MATTALRIPASRTGTPNIPSPHPKPTVSLEEWEAKAPLSDTELRSVTAIQDALREKALPLKEPDTEEILTQSSPATPNYRSDIVNSAQRSGTPRPEARLPIRDTQTLRPNRPVQTTQEFYDWFSLIERSVAHAQEAHYRDHLSAVKKHLDTCEDLADSVDSVHQDVDQMLDGWQSVESGGRSLKDACEELLDERDRLIKLTEDVGARLEYFQELERATRLLNHPGESLVLQSDFLEMVERVDICIDFLRNHRHYREAEIYLLRFHQCMTRAMTLIKMYFVGSLKALTSDIMKRHSSNEISSTAQMHLLYTRFQSVAMQVAPLIGELERRTRSHPEDLSALLAECHSAYFYARKSLLSGRLTEEIKGLDPSRSDLVELTRAGCTYLKQLCIDEFALYKCFFNSGRDLLYTYLESLCDYLYDDLRPRILHEPRLSILCSVCKVLQALMVLDVPEDETSSDEEDGYGRHTESQQGTEQGLGRLHISQMLRSVLQDAQTRLLFKAQTVVQAEVRYYVPKPEELDYPKRLQEALRRLRTTHNKERETTNRFSEMHSFGNRDTWYAALQTTVTVLDQLHEFVQPTIFDDIAQEAIELCRINLLTAANMIAARSSPPEELDAQLFLIRHLLVLKEMISVLDLTDRDADGSFEFRHVAETLRDMLRTTSFIPYAFGTSAIKSRDDTPTTGSKGIDGDLKRACEVIIQLCARSATEPIQDFMLSLDAFSAAVAASPPTKNNATQNNKTEDKREKALVTRSAAIDVEATFRASLEKEVPQIVEKLTLYLAEGEKGTVSVLLAHVQERVVDAYIAFRRAAEILPAEDNANAGDDTAGSGTENRNFASPEDIRTLFKALC
ncbi:Sec34-domain-containing protein [Fomitiporia mediterranea MF3/22]|uniref:Sec34-domain-containing protein n=1 Tax=Fomitiporia mediterranea (strain MF3/22) TaxID=694068 RepID=UPI0004407B72|nr:Sec34-domain-containing protein [Fomitiporia mediterranea MF3/22]EJD02929.1 Sec34-domain-containing protein [Fomitiporia mediterranea MF3/22]